MKRSQIVSISKKRRPGKGDYIIVAEAPISTSKTPMQQVLEIEAARMRHNKKKYQLCKLAGIKAEMYSYLLRRGQMGHELPADCLSRVLKAIKRLDDNKASKAREEKTA